MVQVLDLNLKDWVHIPAQSQNILGDVGSITIFQPNLFHKVVVRIAGGEEHQQENRGYKNMKYKK